MCRGVVLIDVSRAIGSAGGPPTRRGRRNTRRRPGRLRRVPIGGGTRHRLHQPAPWPAVGFDTTDAARTKTLPNEATPRTGTTTGVEPPGRPGARAGQDALPAVPESPPIGTSGAGSSIPADIHPPLVEQLVDPPPVDGLPDQWSGIVKVGAAAVVIAGVAWPRGQVVQHLDDVEQVPGGAGCSQNSAPVINGGGTGGGGDAASQITAASAVPLIVAGGGRRRVQRSDRHRRRRDRRPAGQRRRPALGRTRPPPNLVFGQTPTAADGPITVSWQQRFSLLQEQTWWFR